MKAYQLRGSVTIPIDEYVRVFDDTHGVDHALMILKARVLHRLGAYTTLVVDDVEEDEA